jgi:hypothetical protein
MARVKDWARDSIEFPAEHLLFARRQGQAAGAGEGRRQKVECRRQKTRRAVHRSSARAAGFATQRLRLRRRTVRKGYAFP